MREVRWERMFPDELEAAFAECPVVYFTYGLCEPHGPQNALGLDALKAHAIACETARAHGGIVAPADFWHIHELGGYGHWGHAAVGEPVRQWMTAVPPWHHFKSVLYHIRTADWLGLKAAILLTGHYGPNWEDLNRLVEIVQPYVGTRLYSLPDFEANTPGFDGDGHSGGDHAGKVETSLLWALMPECVDTSRVPREGESGRHFAMGRDARESDRRVGERMVADEVRFLGEKAQQLVAEFDRTAPAHARLTFEQVERLWDEEVAPVVNEFRSMQGRWGNGPEIPNDSIWKRNLDVPDRT